MCLVCFLQITLTPDRSKTKKTFRVKVNFEANFLKCLLHILKIHPSRYLGTNGQIFPSGPSATFPSLKLYM